MSSLMTALRMSCLLVSIGVALAGCGQVKTAEPKAPTSVQVETVTLEPWSRTVSLTGEIRAQVQNDLAFRTSGRIESRSVDVGDHVMAGQELARLEPTLQIADVQSGRAGVQAAEATLEKAKADFQRQQDLMEKGFARRSAFDDAQEALTAARSALQSARAARDTATDSEDKTVLVADSTGIITRRTAEVGQVVAAAQPIFSIAHDGDRDAVFDLYEDLITNKASPIIKVELLSDRSVQVTGRVREVAPVIDPETNTVRVKVGLTDTPPQMTLGAAVVGTGRYPPRDLVVLPWTSLVTLDGVPSVWVMDQETETVSARPVRIAAHRTKKFLVDDGLQAGEIVVTAGAQLLWPGKGIAPRFRNERNPAKPTSKTEAKP